MKQDATLCLELRRKYLSYFNQEHRSFHDLLWQIAINGMLEDEKRHVIFHVDVTPEGNQLVLAYESGGYKNTGVYFISENYNDCCNIVEQINEEFFQIDKDRQVKIIGQSMFN